MALCWELPRGREEIPSGLSAGGSLSGLQPPWRSNPAPTSPSPPCHQGVTRSHTRLSSLPGSITMCPHHSKPHTDGSPWKQWDQCHEHCGTATTCGRVTGKRLSCGPRLPVHSHPSSDPLVSSPRSLEPHLPEAQAGRNSPSAGSR